jgi:GNAT superfamily N-acetyltransferase
MAAGCGAYKEYEPGTVEIKRMFVRDDRRGKGIAGEVLHALEQHARGAGYGSAILETGKKMLSAIRLYERLGYTRISAYGPYIGVESSICMQKQL